LLKTCSTVISVHHAIAQQVTDYWLFPISVQEGCGSSTVDKERTGCYQMKNYRPVSKLSFLSKLLEKVVQRCLQEFLDNNSLMPERQSAYRQHLWLLWRECTMTCSWPRVTVTSLLYTVSGKKVPLYFLP